MTEKMVEGPLKLLEIESLSSREIYKLDIAARHLLGANGWNAGKLLKHLEKLNTVLLVYRVHGSAEDVFSGALRVMKRSEIVWIPGLFDNCEPDYFFEVRMPSFFESFFW